jgi:hypothetical protein
MAPSTLPSPARDVSNDNVVMGVGLACRLAHQRRGCRLTREWASICADLELDPNGGKAVLLEDKVVGSAAPGTAFEAVIARRPHPARILGEPAYMPASVHPRCDTRLETAP